MTWRARSAASAPAARMRSHVLAALLCIVTVAIVQAQQPGGSRFARAEAMVAMRDGVRLYTQVYAPAESAELLPILLLPPNLTPAQIDLALETFPPGR